MRSALPPAEATPSLPTEAHSLHLFRVLAGLIENAGATIAVGDLGDLDGDVAWNATTRTLTLRDTANARRRTYALSEFCRRIHMGPGFSYFIPIPTRRHLRAV